MRVFAERLTALVAEEMAKGTSEADIAREIGLDIRLLGQWKNRGTITKDASKLWLLCRRLHTHPNYLMGWSDDRYSNEEAPRAAELDKELASIKRSIRLRGRRSS